MNIFTDHLWGAQRVPGAGGPGVGKHTSSTSHHSRVHVLRSAHTLNIVGCMNPD